MVGSVVPCQAKHTLFTLVCRCCGNDYLTDLTQNSKSSQKDSCQYLLDTYEPPTNNIAMLKNADNSDKIKIDI